MALAILIISIYPVNDNSNKSKVYSA